MWHWWIGVYWDEHSDTFYWRSKPWKGFAVVKYSVAISRFIFKTWRRASVCKWHVRSSVPLRLPFFLLGVSLPFLHCPFSRSTFILLPAGTNANPASLPTRSCSLPPLYLPVMLYLTACSLFPSSFPRHDVKSLGALCAFILVSFASNSVLW